MSAPEYSYADGKYSDDKYSDDKYSDDKYSGDKYSGDGEELSEKKDIPLNSDIPEDGPALLLMNYDIVFVVSRPKFTLTNPHCLFGSTG